MDQAYWDLAKVVITAAAGFAGVWYGQRNLARKDAKLAEQEIRKADQERAYVASVVIEHLERYVSGCVAVAYDDGTDRGQPAGGGDYYQTTTETPKFDPHTLEVNWHVFPPDLIYDIFAIRSRQEHIESYLDNPGFDDDAPDYSDYFWARRTRFAKQGQQVAKIALGLRKAGGIPNEDLTQGNWSRDQGLADVIARNEAREALREIRHRESMAKLFPVEAT